MAQPWEAVGALSIKVRIIQTTKSNHPILVHPRPLAWFNPPTCAGGCCCVPLSVPVGHQRSPRCSCFPNSLGVSSGSWTQKGFPQVPGIGGMWGDVSPKWRVVASFVLFIWMLFLPKETLHSKYQVLSSMHTLFWIFGCLGAFRASCKCDVLLVGTTGWVTLLSSGWLSIEWCRSWSREGQCSSMGENDFSHCFYRELLECSISTERLYGHRAMSIFSNETWTRDSQLISLWWEGFIAQGSSDDP